MSHFACDVARHSLQPFLDGELAAGDQVAVAAHLEWCPECAEALADMRAVGQLLRVASAGEPPLGWDDAAGFEAGVVTRAKTEWEASWPTRLQDMFDDLHLIYAGLGGVIAMMLSVAVMAGMMRFATTERPDSLAAMVGFLATPASRADAAGVDVESHARWTARSEAAEEAAVEDAVFTLAATLTRNESTAPASRTQPAGRAPHRGTAASAADAKMIDGLIDTLASARLGPKQAEGLPDTGHTVVWMMTHTTVRASETQAARDLPLPAAKKSV